LIKFVLTLSFRIFKYQLAAFIAPVFFFGSVYYSTAFAFEFRHLKFLRLGKGPKKGNRPFFGPVKLFYPNTPQPKAAVQSIEKTTKTIIHMSSCFIMHPLF